METQSVWSRNSLKDASARAVHSFSPNASILLCVQPDLSLCRSQSRDEACCERVLGRSSDVCRGRDVGEGLRRSDIGSAGHERSADQHMGKLYGRGEPIVCGAIDGDSSRIRFHHCVSSTYLVAVFAHDDQSQVGRCCCEDISQSQSVSVRLDEPLATGVALERLDEVVELLSVGFTCDRFGGTDERSRLSEQGRQEDCGKRGVSMPPDDDLGAVEVRGHLSDQLHVPHDEVVVLGAEEPPVSHARVISASRIREDEEMVCNVRIVSLRNRESRLIGAAS